MSDEAKVRLQIHVDDALAARVEALAKRMNRSASWMVAELLIEAVQQRQRFGDWIAWRIVKLVGCADPRKLRGKFRSGTPRPVLKGSAYVQTQVSAEVASDLDKLAAADQRSRADICTLLLNWVVDDEEWLIQAVTSRWAKAMQGGRKFIRGKQSPGNQEENRGRRKVSSVTSDADSSAAAVHVGARHSRQ